MSDLSPAKEAVSIGDRYHFGPQLWHIRGLVDDQVVMRRWSQAKQDWIYKCELLEFFGPEYSFYKKKK